MSVTEIYLLAMLIVFSVPYLIWRLANETFAALSIMAVASTMLTVPAVYPKLHRMRALIFRNA